MYISTFRFSHLLWPRNEICVKLLTASVDGGKIIKIVETAYGSPAIRLNGTTANIQVYLETQNMTLLGRKVFGESLLEATVAHEIFLVLGWALNPMFL